MKKAILMICIFLSGSLISNYVQAGNPPPLFTQPVYLGGSSSGSSTVKKKKQPAAAQTTVIESDITEEPAPQTATEVVVPESDVVPVTVTETSAEVATETNVATTTQTPTPATTPETTPVQAPVQNVTTTVVEGGGTTPENPAGNDQYNF